MRMILTLMTSKMFFRGCYQASFSANSSKEKGWRPLKPLAKLFMDIFIGILEDLMIQSEDEDLKNG